MLAAGYSNRSITAYAREIRFICNYFPELPADKLADTRIIDYMAYLKTVHHASCSKCKKGNLILIDVVYPRNRGSPIIINKSRLFENV